MAYQLQEINRRIRADAAGFLAECDADYAARVSRTADKILNNLSRSPIVLLSGPSGSGKTTTAMKLAEELRRRGINSHAIALDNYFLTVDPATSPRTPEGELDFESPACLDMELLDRHFIALSAGDEVLIPRFDFTRRRRDEGHGVPLRLGKDEVAVFEGIHALNDDIAGRHPEATNLYVSVRSTVRDGSRARFTGVGTRLVRRIVRDYQFRATEAAETLAMWDTVRRGERLYVSPYRPRADVLFDSFLPYEISVMRRFAVPILERVPRGREGYAALRRLMARFSDFEPVDPALVAPDSLLREFIGGGSYDYQ